MRNILFAAFAAATLAISGSANALIIDISAGPNGWGCTTCFGGPNNPDVAPGTTVTLDNQGEAGPLQATLGPGTYSITNAATSGTFSAWNFQGFPTTPNWVWSFLIGLDQGNNTATILKSDFVNSVQPTQAAMAALTGTTTFDFTTQLSATSTAGFVDTLSLASTTTLDFFIDDGFLPDNGGGVALDIECVSGACLGGGAPVPEPASIALLGTALAGLGLLRRRKLTSQGLCP